jgi:hypothetical protein
VCRIAFAVEKFKSYFSAAALIVPFYFNTSEMKELFTSSVMVWYLRPFRFSESLTEYVPLVLITFSSGA